LDNLPAELQQNLTLMREIDSRTQKVIGDIGKQTDDYFKSKAYLTDKNKKKMNRIQSQFDEAKAYSDDKVQLAVQTYALVCRFRVLHVIQKSFYSIVPFRWMNK